MKINQVKRNMPLVTPGGKPTAVGDDMILTLNELVRRAGGKSESRTVANLPTAEIGMRSVVTDATVTTFASVVAGGGTNVVPVYADNAGNWRIG